MSEESTPKAPEVQAMPTQMPVHLIKSNYFRVIHVDGALGGLTPSGNAIQMIPFSQRVAIPQLQIYGVQEGRLTSAPEVQEGRPGMVRELECAVIMDLDTSKALHNWLGVRISQLEDVQSKKQKA